MLRCPLLQPPLVRLQVLWQHSAAAIPLLPLYTCLPPLDVVAFKLQVC